MQSALLEAMGERQVTAGRHSFALPDLFLVMQNPIEREGTYPLPEAQLNRLSHRDLGGRHGISALAPIAAVALLGLAAAAWHRHARGPAERPGSLRSTRRALRRACRRGNPAAATAALRQLRARDPRSLPETPARREALDRLSTVQYSASTNREKEWNGVGLWAAYRAAARDQQRRPPAPPKGGLPPLYPDTHDQDGAHQGSGP